MLGYLVIAGFMALFMAGFPIVYAILIPCIGYVLIVAPEDATAIGTDLDRLGLAHWQIGQVTAAGDGERLHIR